MTAAPGGLERAVTLFHEVRRYTYLSDGVRDPAIIAARQAGACTGKHILLRDRLRSAGYTAWIETAEGDFAAAMPQCQTMPPDLAAMVAEAGVEDFHHFVRLEWEGRSILLDATWHDSMRLSGFAVNDGWTGPGETVPALTPRRVFGPQEDIVAFKKACLDTMSAPALARRARFLKLFSAWVAVRDRQLAGVGAQPALADASTVR